MNFKVLLAFAVIYLVWGSTFTAIKLGLDSFPPFLLSGFRFMLAGVTFFLISSWNSYKLMTKKEVGRDMLTGFLLSLGNAGVCWAEQHISSGVAALILGSIPLMFILVNYLSFDKQRPSFTAMAGIFIGMLGITLISLDKASASNWRVVLVLLLANLSWVVGSLMFKKSQSKVDYFPRAAIQTFTGGAILVIYNSIFGTPIDWYEVKWLGGLSVAYLALAGTVLAYTAYSYLLKNVKTEIASTYALVNPLVALMLGVIFLNEPFTLKVGFAAALILLSVVMVLYGDKLVLKPIRIKAESDAYKLKKCG